MIQTGEDAIKFFAKYGNTTPIKFINCVSKAGAIELQYEAYLKKDKMRQRKNKQPEEDLEVPMEFNKSKEPFRPYDLIVVKTREN